MPPTPQSTPVESPTASAVAIADVAKSYRHGHVEIRALAGASLTVGDGEFVAIMGPSGSGKSTLLALIAGLDVPTRGTIHVHGACVSAMSDDEATAFRRRHVGLIYQHFNLFPDLTLEENVAVPLLLEGRSGGDVIERVRRALERVGLDGRRDHLPTEVSGGEVQRTAIARAFVTEPAIILADEPTGNLDSATGTRILDDMRRAVDEDQRTIILVTHDPIAAGYADRIARLRDGAFEAS